MGAAASEAGRGGQAPPCAGPAAFAGAAGPTEGLAGAVSPAPTSAQCRDATAVAATKMP